MAETVGITPAELRATADHLADVSSRMMQVLSSLNTSLDAEGSVWGDDELGKGFAEGENGYLAQHEWVGGSVDAKTDLLNDYSVSLRTAADTLEQQDEV